MTSMLLRINAALFVAYGLAFVFAPDAASRGLFGAAPATAAALTDMRATYGGLSLGLGGFFALCAKRDPLLGLQGVVLVMAGFATARALGMVLDWPDGWWNGVMLLGELVMAGLALRALIESTDLPLVTGVA